MSETDRRSVRLSLADSRPSVHFDRYGGHTQKRGTVGLFRRNDRPASAGQTAVYLTPDGKAVVSQQSEPALGPEIISVLAVVSGALWVAKALDGSGHDGNGWLDEISALDDSESLNSRVNPGGVIDQSRGVPTSSSSSIVGQFLYLRGRRPGEGTLVGTWNPSNRFSPVEDGYRVFGALFAHAELLGEGRAVWHAIQAFEGAQFDLQDPRVLTELPQRLLDHVGQQRAIENQRPPWLDEE